MPILFTDLYGKQLPIPAERVAFRPSAYGLIVHEGRLLVCNTKSTGKWSLPGGAVDIGEKVVDALMREITEECGIRVEVQKFLGFEESFFYYNPLDKASQVIAFFYLCKPLTLELAVLDPHELEAEAPQWVDIDSLRAVDFQAFGDVVVKTVREIRGITS